MRRFTAGFLFCLMVFTVYACARRPPEPPPPNRFLELYSYRAFTICEGDNRAIFFVRGYLLFQPPAEIRATIAHEMSHVNVMNSFGSCEAYHKWRSQAGNSLVVELLGRCAAVRQRISDGMPHDSALAKEAGEIARVYRVENAVERVRAFCPGV